MERVVTLTLPENIATAAIEEAEHTHSRMEDVLVAWLHQVTTERPLESLPDEQVLALADLQMEPELQQELSELLYENEEGTMTDVRRERLNEVMKMYRTGMVRKARALEVAVTRGLQPQLG